MIFNRISSQLIMATTFALLLVPAFGTPAFAGGGGGACTNSNNLADLLSNPTRCVAVDDKTFTNFRLYTGPFPSNQILVTGVTVDGERGLQFNANPSQSLNVFGGQGTGVGLGISFVYDVISSGDPISDNTLTLDVFGVTDVQNSQFTNVRVDEMVFEDGLLQELIVSKDVFADADPINVADDLEDHVDYLDLYQMVTVQVEIGLITQTNCPDLCIAFVDQFTQTFSQSPRVVGGELLPIDNAALMVAGMQTNAVWIMSALAVIGSVAFSTLYITTKKN